MDALAREKQLLRAEMKKQLASFTDAQKKEESTEICSVLASSRFWPSLSGLAAFLPLQDEPNLHPLFERALAEGKAFYLPRIDGEDLVFHTVSSFKSGLRPHAYGMPEPSPDLPPADWSAAGGPLLFLVPGLAFDRRGGRLGRGKGFYDRFFLSFAGKTPGNALVLGAAFSCQLAGCLPLEKTDYPLDGLVTHKGIFFTQEAAIAKIPVFH